MIAEWNSRLRRLGVLALWLAVLIGVAGCASRGDSLAQEKPRLVVLLVMDGLPQWQVVQHREQLAADGLRRFLDRGAWFAQAQSESRTGAPFFDQMRKSWHRELSGDVQFALKPYWMIGSRTSITTHGSPHAYDPHVPILLYGHRWIAPGRVDARVEMVDIAPTLAGLLRVPVPAAAEGRALPLKRPVSVSAVD